MIRSSSWEFVTHEIEEHVLGLPNVQESYILGVAEEDCGERVAAIVRSRSTSQKNAANDTSALSLAWLRETLTTHPPLPKYKLPTLLKILQTGEEVPRKLNGKTSKNLARTPYFSPRFMKKGEIEVLDLNNIPQMTQRAWDYDGLGVE